MRARRYSNACTLLVRLYDGRLCRCLHLCLEPNKLNYYAVVRGHFVAHHHRNLFVKMARTDANIRRVPTRCARHIHASIFHKRLMLYEVRHFRRSVGDLRPGTASTGCGARHLQDCQHMCIASSQTCRLFWQNEIACWSPITRPAVGRATFGPNKQPPPSSQYDACEEVELFSAQRTEEALCSQLLMAVVRTALSDLSQASCG